MYATVTKSFYLEVLGYPCKMYLIKTYRKHWQAVVSETDCYLVIKFSIYILEGQRILSHG